MKFGQYKWMSYNDVKKVTENLARGINGMNLTAETEGDGRKWRFVGIWAKNRWEWLATHIANMYFKNTTIGFFDSMGAQSVDFILKQTELSTIFVAKEYIAKLISMKKDGLASKVKNLVTFDPFTQDEYDKCHAAGIKLHDFNQVVRVGKEFGKVDFNKCTEDDSPLFSYTSGTTGDSKGVKLTHKNLLKTCASL